MLNLFRLLLILLAMSAWLVCPAFASSWCSCEGQAEGINPQNTSQLAHEKLIKVDPAKTKCKGHSCCPDFKQPLRIWSGEKAKGLWGYGAPISYTGEHSDFKKIAEGKNFKFKFSCWDSALGQGSNSIEIVGFIN